MNRCIAEFQPMDRRVEAAMGITLLKAAQQSDVPVTSDCGGKGTCGRCRVEVLSGDVLPPDQDECRVLESNGASKAERLACRMQLRGDIKIHIPKASRDYDQFLQLQEHMVLPEGDQLIPSDLTNRGMQRIGIAVDLGTTKIAGLLLDMESGKEICTTEIMNPQISYGADVISRLEYVIHEKNGDQIMARLLRETINNLLKTLCNNGRVSPGRISDITICGNTAMSHLLLQLPVGPLARAPYIAGFTTPIETDASQLDLNIAPDAQVLVLPCIGGFIGGDHVAMILACDIDRFPQTALGIDIGTNTEIVLVKPGANGGLFVVSCASGPALEGGHVRDGMRAMSGAIEQVRLTSNGPVIKTINGEPPLGICGSGLVDVLSELLRFGIVDKRGHLQVKENSTPSVEYGAEYVLVPADATGTGRDISITQRDISEIQLAKGAIQAGIRALLDRAGTLVDEVDRVYLAGAFGSHLNIDSALSIGLLPDLPKARFIRAGNAAAAGASMTLISKEDRKRAAAIALQARHIELASDPKFSRLLPRAMRF